MERRWLIAVPGIALLMLITPLTRGQDYQGELLVSIETAPRGSFHVMTYEREDEPVPFSEVYIAEDRLGTIKRQLFRGYGATRVLVSPDEQWIVLAIRESHDFGTFETYRYLGDLEFEAHDAEVERRVLATLMKSRGLTEPPEFSRYFCHASIWSSHSNSLLGYLETQHTAGRPPSRFYFVYGLESRKVTLDLSVFNNPAPSRQRDAASR